MTCPAGGHTASAWQSCDGTQTLTHPTALGLGSAGRSSRPQGPAPHTLGQGRCICPAHPREARMHGDPYGTKNKTEEISKTVTEKTMIQREDLTFANVYAPTMRAREYLM